MKPYDSFDHYDLPENNRAWIYNRCLFLIYLQEKNNMVFHGGDGMTVDEVLLNFRDSYYPEYCELLKKNAELFNKAWVDWINNGDKPRYARV